METFPFETYLLALKKAKTDNEKFAALLMVAKVTKESACNKEVKKQILEAVGPKFFSRLLRTKSVPEGCPENIYKSVAMSILSALSGDPDVACSSAMLENVTAFNMIIILDPSVSEDDTKLVDDTYECLNSLCQTTDGQDALVKAKTLSALSQAIVDHMYSSQKAVQLLISILSSTGSHAWKGCEAALNALMGHIAEDFKNEMSMKKFELCKTLIFLLTTMPRHIVKNVDPPWAHEIVTGLDRILRSKLGSCQREPALKLTAMLIDVCGVQCVLPPAVTDSKLFLLITHLCCVEVRMVLEDSDIKLAFQKGRLLSSCYSILETVINHMTGGPSLELDSRQVLQLHSALVGAFSAVLYFLRRVDEDRTIQWDSVVLATVRVLAAWLSEETSAVRNEVYQLIPFIVEISKKCVPPSEDFFQAKTLSEKSPNTNENSSPRENNCDNYIRTRNTEVVMDSLSKTLDTALDIVKPSDRKEVLDKDKTNESKVEITDNHESNTTEEVQDSETSLEKVSQVSESQNNTHNIDLDENSNTKSSDVDEKTDLINVQNSDEKVNIGDTEKHVSFNLNQNSIPDHLTCTEQLECCDLENENMISNHDGHSEEMQADDSSQTNTTEIVDSLSALAVASADHESTVSVINSVVKTEQEVNNSENNQNEATIAKTESVILASADSESTVSVINSAVKTEQEVNNSENNQKEATIAKTESVNNQNEATVSVINSVVKTEQEVNNSENNQNEATLAKTESVIKQDHEVTIDSFVNDSATCADVEMSEEELQDLHLRVDIFRFLLPGLCHLTSEDISRSVLIQEGILALLDLYMWRQWNLFNQDPQNKEIQSSLVILCNIFLNLVIIEPKLVVEREEFCHVLLLVVKGIKELELEGNYLVLWSHMATLGLMLLRALSQKTDSFLELESINRFFVSGVRFLSGAYTVEFKKKLATGLTVSEGYRQSWDQVSQTWFLSMQAFCSCVPLYSILPSVILKSGWIPALTKSLLQAKGRGVEEETRSCFLMLLTTVTKSDKSSKDLVMEKGGDEIARMYKSKDLTEALKQN